MKRVSYFVAITYALSLSLILGFYFSGGRWNTSSAYIIATIYMFIPLLSAVLVQRFVFKRSINEFIATSFKFNRWFVLASILPFIACVLTFLFSLKMPGVGFTPDMSGLFERYLRSMSPEQVEKLRNQMSHLPVHPLLITTVQAIFAGFTVNAFAAFGEEAGWRGFLQHEFRNLGFIKTSFLIGIIWGVWHAPMILMGHNYPDHHVPGVFMMIIVCLLLSPFFSYVRLKSGSTIAASIVHGTFNAAAGLPLLVIKGGSDLTIGAMGIAGILALIVIDSGIFIYDRYFAEEKVIFKSLQLKMAE